MLIREYLEQDLAELLSLWEDASAIAHPFLTQEFIASERENIINIYLPNTETWIAEEDGQVVGFISLLGNEVGGIFVSPNHQKKGIGRKLMDKARSRRGELTVEVFVANNIGRDFYDKYGFELIEQKLHEPTGFYVLRLRLPEER